MAASGWRMFSSLHRMTDGAHRHRRAFFHDTVVGRFVVSVVLVAILAMTVIWNLPDSPVEDDLKNLVRPVVLAVGLQQGWELFAPNPTRTVVHVSAEVVLADDEVIIHEFPEGDNGVGALRQYRWRKYLRRLRLADYRRLWEPAAAWVAAQYESDVAEVRLVREEAFIDDPLADTLVFEREVFFTWEP